MGSDDDPEGTVRIRDAVADLPGKWPRVREATVDVAVPLVPEAEVGVLSIFLPTELPSGLLCSHQRLVLRRHEPDGSVLRPATQRAALEG